MSPLRIFALALVLFVGCKPKEDPKPPEPGVEPKVEVKPVEPNFTSTKARFKIWISGDPKEEDVGMEGSYYSLTRPEAFYSIQEYRYKDPYQRNDEVDLDNVRELVKLYVQKDFKEAKRKELKHAKDVAIQLDGTVPDETTKTDRNCIYQVILVGDRGFVLQVVSDKSLDHEDVKKFLSSFRSLP